MSQEAFDQIRDKNVKSSKVSTTKSNKLRNVSDFIWSKLTNTRKNSSLNISKTNSESKLFQSATIKDSKCLIDSTNTKCEKKNRKNIFHIFESSSKLKLNTGVNRKNFKSNNKSPTKKQTKSENEISLCTERPSEEAVLVQKEEELGPDLDSLKVNLMDNSILKSKISAARRNPRTRQTSAKSDSNLSSSNSYQAIEIKTSSSKICMEPIAENENLENEKLNESESSGPIANLFAKSTSYLNSESENLESSQLSTKAEQNTAEIVEEETKKVKIAIYDNNITQCSNFDEKSNSFDIFESINNQFKSKSCEKIHLSASNKDSNNNYSYLKNANNHKNANYVKNNRFSYVDGNKLEKIDLSKVMLKSLSHSRSLKLKSPDSAECESSSSKKKDESSPILKSIGQFSNSYKLPNSKKREPIIAKCTENNQEPVWKELAFRKHNAWSRKNLEHSPISDKPSEDFDQNNDQATIEGKVKSMVRDFQKT